MVCRRAFRRESHKAKHKCISERKKPVHQQTGAIQCVGDGLRAREV